MESNPALNQTAITGAFSASVHLIFFLLVYKNYRSFVDTSIAMLLNLNAFITICIFMVTTGK